MKSPTYSSPEQRPVHPSTIANFESRGSRSLQQLFDDLKDRDANLAYFIRRRAIQLNPDDLSERERMSRLALEAVAILGRDLVAEQARVEEIARLEMALNTPPAPDIAA